MATEAQKVTYAEVAAPSTPAAAKVVTYAKADGLMYSKDDAGVETLMSGGTGTLTDHSHKVTGTGSTGGGLLAAIGCMVSGTSTALTSGAFVSLAFGTADTFDSDAFHDPASSNTLITVPANKGGKYHLHMTLSWPSSGSANTDRRMGYRINGGADVNLRRETTSVTSIAITDSVSTVIILAAGDTLEIRQWTGIASTTTVGYSAQLFLIGV